MSMGAKERTPTIASFAEISTQLSAVRFKSNPAVVCASLGGALPGPPILSSYEGFSCSPAREVAR